MITDYLSEPYILVLWVAIVMAFAYTLWPQREDDDLRGERLIEAIEQRWLRDARRRTTADATDSRTASEDEAVSQRRLTRYRDERG